VESWEKDLEEKAEDWDDDDGVRDTESLELWVFRGDCGDFYRDGTG
jgi:hypothetical protein